MKYYMYAENQTVQTLREILEEEAQRNPMWTLQELFAMCRNLSFLDDVPENADYFDEIYLIFAELFTEFNRYGQFDGGSWDLQNVRAFSADEESEKELISALDALYSGMIQGRKRVLTARWEKEGTWQEWRQHIGELRTETAAVWPTETGSGWTEETRTEEPGNRKKSRGNRKKRAAVSAVVLAVLLSAAGWLAYKNINALYRFLPAVQGDECTSQNGVLIREKDGKPFTGRIHSESGSTLSVYTYKDGRLDGLDVVYYNGAVKETGFWKEGKQDGLFTLYTTEGVLVDYANFRDGERHGLTRQYDAKTGRMTCEGNFKNGQMEGTWTQYDPYTGMAVIEQTYRDGALHGPAKQYYEDGQLHIDMTYENGIPQGPYKAYYPGGQIQVEDSLENGSYSSHVKMYEEDGTPIEITWGTSGSGIGDTKKEEVTITEE